MSDFRIYCDESCHLAKDGQSHMVLGAVWCPTAKVKEITKRLHEIKASHNLRPHFELKWGSVSPAKLDYYRDVLDYWADDDDLCFRGVIIDKAQLDHSRIPEQDHDNWYYKMYFTMLRMILCDEARYEIFIDIKDTHGIEKLRQLRKVLCTERYDFDQRIIRRVQNVRSHEVELVQLADFLIGIISYANRQYDTSEAKLSLVRRLRERTRLALTKSTLPRARKMNLLQWRGWASDVMG